MGVAQAKGVGLRKLRARPAGRQAGKTICRVSACERPFLRLGRGGERGGRTRGAVRLAAVGEVFVRSQ